MQLFGTKNQEEKEMDNEGQKVPQGNENEGQAQEPKTYTEEELKDFAQKEADRRVTQAQEKFKKQSEEEVQKAVQEALSEAKRLEQMSDDDKQKEAADKRAKELDEREAKIKKSELVASTRAVLHDNNLPSNLAESLVALGDAEAINTTIKSLGATIKEQVSQGVKDQLKTATPQAGEGKLDHNPFKDVFANDPKYRKR